MLALSRGNDQGVEVAPETLPVLSDLEERFALEVVATGDNYTKAYLRVNPGVTYGAAKVQAITAMNWVITPTDRLA